VRVQRPLVAAVDGVADASLGSSGPSLVVVLADGAALVAVVPCPSSDRPLPFVLPFDLVVALVRVRNPCPYPLE